MTFVEMVGRISAIGLVLGAWSYAVWLLFMEAWKDRILLQNVSAGIPSRLEKRRLSVRLRKHVLLLAVAGFFWIVIAFRMVEMCFFSPV